MFVGILIEGTSSRKKGSPKKSPSKGGPPGYVKESPENHPDMALRKAQELLEAVASKPQQSVSMGKHPRHAKQNLSVL